MSRENNKNNNNNETSFHKRPLFSHRAPRQSVCETGCTFIVYIGDLPQVSYFSDVSLNICMDQCLVNVKR